MSDKSLTLSSELYNTFEFFVCMLAFGSMGIALFHLAAGVEWLILAPVISVISRENFDYNSCAIVLGVCMFLGAAGAITQRLMKVPKGRFMLAILPGILLLPLPLFPAGIWQILLVIVIYSLVGYRIALLFPERRAPKFLNRQPVSMVLMFCLTGVAVLYGLSMQLISMRTLSMLYWDWGVYYDVAANTLRGKWFITSEGGNNFLGEHFCPGAILLLCPWVWMFPSYKAFFLLNSLVLYSVPVGIYFFARVKKLSPAVSLILASCTVLSPSLANLNVTLMYGFHSIYLFMPLLVLFFIFYEKKKFIPAFIIFLFSLTIKETVPVFWVCMGFILAVRGDRRQGALIFIIALVYWFSVVKMVIPAISGVNHYNYVGRFGQLGNSIFAIGLSPILKPVAFWGSLFRGHCVYFVLMLLVPAFFLTLSRPLLLLGGALTVMFICLQDSDQLQNIAMQYQAEVVALVWINAVIAFRSILKRGDNIWIRLLNWGITGFSKRRVATGMLAATLISSLMAWYFFGQSHIGKNNFSRIVSRYDWSGEIAELEKLIPPDAGMNATRFLSGHFISRNRVYPNFNELQDYVLLDLTCFMYDHEALDDVRKELIKCGYRVIYHKSAANKVLVLYAKNSKYPRIKPELYSITDNDWNNFGENIRLADNISKDFEVKTRNVENDTFRGNVVSIRLLGKVDYDVNVNIIYSDEKNNKSLLTVFGNGAVPAFIARPGDVFVINCPRPEGIDVNAGFVVKLVPRRSK